MVKILQEAKEALEWAGIATKRDEDALFLIDGGSIWTLDGKSLTTSPNGAKPYLLAIIRLHQQSKEAK